MYFFYLFLCYVCLNGIKNKLFVFGAAAKVIYHNNCKITWKLKIQMKTEKRLQWSEL